MQSWINVFLKLFFLLTPFFVLSMFLAMTSQWERRARHILAIRITAAVTVLCGGLLLFGEYVFSIFGITIDAFRVGAGILLFLSGLSLSRGEVIRPASDEHDIAVVPMAMPITVGPATTGALLVMGGEITMVREKLLVGSALLAAIFCVGLLLYVASEVERHISRTGLSILSRLTGLILASMAAQMVFEGIRGLLHTPITAGP
ncbi:MAG: MarC family protein [Phycisphaerales bacterium]|nr:MarC family protein [Phycisphaerales bacterium]